MRKNIIAGNWKMNLDRKEAICLVDNIICTLPDNNTEIIIAPSFVYLYKVAKMCADINRISVAAQDCSSSDNGAFTGEVSASILSSCNVDYVILGHSERRINFSESNEVLKFKVNKALSSGLKVIFCCGETLEHREKNIYFDFIKQQIKESLFDLNSQEFMNIVIAYEPIWAIGTGNNATPDQAQAIHAFIRELLVKRYGKEIANNTSILYGGSCNRLNASELFKQNDIDGGLIGGASLVADDFLTIIRSF